MRSRLARAAVVASLMLCAASARADDTVDEARAEYDLGSKELDANRYATAASHFARADELAPNPMVLDLALRAAVRSEAATLAMELADRADSRNIDGALAKQVRSHFARTTGRIVVRCPEGSTCSARVDDRIVPNDVPSWVAAGDHVVELAVDGHVDKNTLRVDPGATLDVRPVTLQSPPRAKAPAVVRSVSTTTRPVPLLVYGLAATAVAGFGTWGIAGISGLYGSPSLRTLKECDPYCAQGTADAVHTKLLVGDIGFGVGAASTALAVVFYLTRPRVTTTTSSAGGPSVSFDAHGVFAGYTWTR